MKAKDISVGSKIGALTVERIERISHGGRKCFCKCDCGGHIVVKAGLLTSMGVRSCGCLNPRAKSLCNACKRELSECEWLLSRPTRDKIGWWAEQGIEIEVKEAKEDGYMYDLFIVNKCPWYIK